MSREWWPFRRLRGRSFEPTEAEKRRVHNASVWGGFSTFWAALVGALALIGIASSFWTTQRSIEEQRREAAYAQYAEYLKLAVEQPEQSVASGAGYPAFVAYLLYSCERVLEVDDSDGWRRACEGEVADHKDALQSQEEGTYCSYSQTIRALINQTLVRDRPCRCTDEDGLDELRACVVQ